MNAAAMVREHLTRSATAAEAFFSTHSPSIAATCRQMADRFERGGTLIVFGSGAQATDAHHVAVEFVHPIVVGKRALPAVALTSDVAVLTAARGEDPDDYFAAPLQVLGTAADIALGLCGQGTDKPTERALAAARRRGMLTVLATGSREPARRIAECEFHIPADDPMLVQELEETLYHVLWEVVHVFFEARGALNPFQFAAVAVDARLDTARDHARESIQRKGCDIAGIRQVMAASSAQLLAEAARAIAARVAAGGRILAFGNGGSATDAQDVVADCMAPADRSARPLAALALTNDVGVLTAVANDVGFEHVFSRQVDAFGRAGDVAIAFSTSGESSNVVRAMDVAKARGLLTVALSGTGGGALAHSSAVDFSVTAPADYVPRIQEAHASAWHAMLRVVRALLDDTPATVTVDPCVGVDQRSA